MHLDYAIIYAIYIYTYTYRNLKDSENKSDKGYPIRIEDKLLLVSSIGTLQRSMLQKFGLPDALISRRSNLHHLHLRQVNKIIKLLCVPLDDTLLSRSSPEVMPGRADD